MQIEISDVSKFINPLSGARVLAVTYNAISQWPAGMHYPCPGLEIQVCAGDYVPYGGSAAGFLSNFTYYLADNFEAADRVNALESLAAAQAQDNVAKQVGSLADPVLGIVYAGLQAFGPAFDFADSLKSQNSANKVIVVTCSCDMVTKRARLQSNSVDAYLVGECSGRNTMGAALASIVQTYRLANELGTT